MERTYKACIEEWQEHIGVKADGKFGEKTLEASYVIVGQKPAEGGDPVSTQSPSEDSISIQVYPYTKDLVYKDEGDEIKQLQAMLKYQGFGKYLGSAGVDGVFGGGTRKGIEEYVRGRGLNAPAIEATNYKTVTKDIWEMFFLEPYDIEGSIFTDEYTKCNCNGKWCNGHYDKYGVSLGTVLVALRLQDEVRIVYGSNAKVRLTDDLGFNGGSRCVNQNKLAKGASRSQHIKSRAFDVYVSNADKKVDYEHVQQLACKVNPYGGCSENYDNVAHIDSRGKPERW